MNKKILSFYKTVLPLVFMVSSLLLLYRKVLLFMVRQWWTLDMYSHGFIIPLISFYMIWKKRKEIRKIKTSPSYIIGFMILLAGMLLFVSGEAGGVIILQALSILPTIFGILFMLFGSYSIKIFLLPISYLIFMIPIWEIVTHPIHFPFQRLSATLGGMILNLLQIPAYVNGTIIEIPNSALNVVKECSGANYLISIIAIGIPLAFLNLKSMVKRSILIISAIFIAIFANGLRVSLVGIFTYRGIGNDPHGPLHIMQGVMVSLVGYAVLLTGALLMGRERNGILKEKENKENNHANYKSPFFIKKISYPAILVIILFVSVEIYNNLHSPKPVPLKADLNQFPYEINGWEGKDTKSTFIKYHFPGVDSKLIRKYQKGSNTIDLYLGYYEFQKQGKELIYYKTKELHSNASKINIKLNPHGNIAVGKAIIKEKGNRKLIFFWYDINGRVIICRNMAKFFTIWDALTKNKTNGAVIMLSSEIKSENDIIDKENAIKEFIQVIYPYFNKYFLIH